MTQIKFAHYNSEYISGVLSLREPQSKSLQILENILEEINLDNFLDLEVALNSIKSKYPTCTNFERDFISLTFALATGVGKTRLMGAFITYLYACKGIKNFFIVAPGTTVYKKLIQDIGDPSNPKYVFNGVGCFNNPPNIITGDDYQDRQLKLYTSDINIFLFNIDKFNKDTAKLKEFNEYLGESFFDKIANLKDLVLIMDESHHYRAEKGMSVLNELKPLIGLELTATPLVNVDGKQMPFKNVVYEFPLSKAIEKGYTRTPFAVTRTDIDFFNFGDEQLDKLMLNDGIICHEKVKNRLVQYSNDNNVRLVKPFMLVVCKDTTHADWVEKYIKSSEFYNGKYKNKVIKIHSKLKGSESEENLSLLLEVEKATNLVEIVIHVNVLKEGWDVNNLYTIVPLRTASSKILREQMVGRGLRLPFGERVNDLDIDAVMLTAHNKFKEILEEAQKGDSIFKAGNVIKVEEIVQEDIQFTQLSLQISEDERLTKLYNGTNLDKSETNDEFLLKSFEKVTNAITNNIHKKKNITFSKDDRINIVNSIKEEITQENDLSDVFKENEFPFMNWIEELVENTYVEVKDRYIPIPRIRITDRGVEEYRFVNFDLDLSVFNHVPLENDLIIQNLTDLSERINIKNIKAIDFEGFNPISKLLSLLRDKPEVDYEKCSELLFKLITQVIHHFESKYNENGMKNIVMMSERDLTEKIYEQMMQHFYCENGFLVEEVVSLQEYNYKHAYNYAERKNLFESYDINIRNVLFEDIKRGVFSEVKFDSNPELLFARILERSDEVQKWLRPNINDFNITYNNGKHYIPDFVVETANKIYLVEVKGEDKLNNPDVIAKKSRAIKYCEVVTRWGKPNGYKPWEYIFIPSLKVKENSTFNALVSQFKELN